MAKQNKGNKAPVIQSGNAPQNAVASAWQKATAGIGAIAALATNEAPIKTLPTLDKDLVIGLDKAEPEKTAEIEKLLVEIIDVAKKLRDLHEDSKKRGDALAEKEAAVERRSA